MQRRTCSTSTDFISTRDIMLGGAPGGRALAIVSRFDCDRMQESPPRLRSLRRRLFVNKNPQGRHAQNRLGSVWGCNAGRALWRDPSIRHRALLVPAARPAARSKHDPTHPCADVEITL